MRAAYEDTEIDVRADGMTPPVIVKPPERARDGERDKKSDSATERAREGAREPRQARARCIRCDIVAQQDAAEQAARARPFASRGRQRLRRPRATTRSSSGRRGSAPCPRSGTSSCRTISSTCRCATESPRARARASAAASTGSRSVCPSRAKASPCRRRSSGAASPRDAATCASPTGASPGSTRRRSATSSSARRRSSRREAGTGGKLPLSQAGRLQELLEQVNRATVSTEAKDLFTKLRDVDEIKGAEEAAQPEGVAPPLPGVKASTGSPSSTRSARAVSSPTTWGSARRCRRLALLLSVKTADEKAAAALSEKHAPSLGRGPYPRRSSRPSSSPPTSVVTNWTREIDKFAPEPEARAVARRRSQGAAGGARGGGRGHHQLRAPPA